MSKNETMRKKRQALLETHAFELSVATNFTPEQLQQLKVTNKLRNLERTLTPDNSSQDIHEKELEAEQIVHDFRKISKIPDTQRSDKVFNHLNTIQKQS